MNRYKIISDLGEIWSIFEEGSDSEAINYAHGLIADHQSYDIRAEVKIGYSETDLVARVRGGELEWRRT